MSMVITTNELMALVLALIMSGIAGGLFAWEIKDRMQDYEREQEESQRNYEMIKRRSEFDLKRVYEYGCQMQSQKEERSKADMISGLEKMGEEI